MAPRHEVIPPVTPESIARAKAACDAERAASGLTLDAEGCVVLVQPRRAS